MNDSKIVKWIHKYQNFRKIILKWNHSVFYARLKLKLITNFTKIKEHFGQQVVDYIFYSIDGAVYYVKDLKARDAQPYNIIILNL